MNKPLLVSVVVPTFNRADLIIETIQSVLNQTYKNLEIFIIDDGSTDQTADLIKKIADARIKYIKISNSGRPAIPRNIGIKQAKGEYIAFLDSDDIWQPQKIEKQLNIFKKYPKLNIVATAQEDFPGGRKERYLFNRIISFKKLLRKNIIANSSVLIRKEVFSKIGLLDEDPRLRAVEDYDLWLRVLRFEDNSVYLLKDCLLLYRIHQTNITRIDNSCAEKTPVEKLEIIFNKHKEYKNGYSISVLSELKQKIFINNVKEQLYFNKINIFTVFKNDSISFDEKLSILLIYLLKRIKISFKRVING